MKKTVKLFSFLLAAILVFTIQLPLTGATPTSSNNTPKLTITSSGAATISLKWTTFSRADGYKVYRKTSKDGKWKTIKTTAKGTYTDKKLKLGKTYWYKVRAYRKSGKSTEYTPYSKVKYSKTKLPKPTIKISGVSANAIKISVSKSKAAEGVVIYRKNSKNGTWKKIKSTTAKTYTKKSLKYKKTYYYKAKAYKKVGKKYYYSAYSSQKKAKAYVRKVKVSDKHSSSVVGKIKWNKVYGATKYQVYMRGATGKFKYKTSTKSTYMTIRNSAGWLNYKVRAVQKVGSKSYYGSLSSVIRYDWIHIKDDYYDTPNEAYVNDPSNRPVVLNFSGVSANEMKIAIDKPKDADGVDIYRKTSINGKWVKIKRTTADTYTDKNLTYNKTYYYKATAYKKINKKYYYTNYSEVISEKTHVGTVNLIKPSAQSPIVWNKIYGATKYQIYRSVSEGEYKYYKTTTSTSFTDPSGTTSTAYKVRALQIVGDKTYYGDFSYSIYFDVIVSPPNNYIGRVEIKKGSSVVDRLNFGGKTFTMAIDQHSQYHSDSFLDTVAAFEKKFNCKIKYKELNFSTYNQQIATLIAQGKAPEICYVHGSMFPDCAIKELYNPLNDHLSSGDIMNGANPTTGGIDPNKTTYFIHNREIYGTCNYNSCFPYVIYYNKKQMADAGFSGNKDPRILAERTNSWTWDFIKNLGRKLTKDDVYFLSNSFTGRGLPLSFGGNIVTLNNGVYKENITSTHYMEAMKFMQSITSGAAIITEPRDSAHPYNSYKTLLSGKAYLWLEETCKYPDLYNEISGSEAFQRNVNNLEITTVPLGFTNTMKAYPTGWLTAVASGKGTDPRVAIAWDVFRSGYKSEKKGASELNEEDQSFADELIQGAISCEVGCFGTDSTTTLSLTESGLVPKVATGSNITDCINAVKNQMT